MKMQPIRSPEHEARQVERANATHAQPLVFVHGLWLLASSYTPTYSSWLNQVELWFSKIERDVIARGVFTSVKDPDRKLMRYIRHYKQSSQAGEVDPPRSLKAHYY